MPVIETHNLVPGAIPYQYQVYNGLDCCVTYEVFKELRSLYPSDPMIYNFERALQAPVLEMMLRGFRVDEYERQKGIESLRKEISRMDNILQRFAFAIWSKGLNPRSPKQLIDFFYSAMKLPEVWISFKGQRKLSTNREALEKLELYFHARPIISCILTIRDLGKKISVLETEVSADGRMRTSYNIAGTETGRWSSSSSADGTGTNLQNITRELRKIFISDDGWKLCGIDLEQAESREVGWLCGVLFGDWTYLDACYGGDLHTTVCRMTWKDLPWNGEKAHDRAIADQVFYRDYSYRDMAKKLGHGCLTEDHEVLTRNGWVSIKTCPAEIMIYDPNLKQSKFGLVSNWIDKPYDGEMISIETTSLSLLATSDHRVLFTKDGAKGKIHETPAGNLPKVGGIPLGGGFVGGAAKITPQIARLIAAFQCDGSRETDTRIAFHFHKLRKMERILKLAKDAGIETQIHGTKIKLVRYDFSSWDKDAGAYLLNWPRDALSAYITEHKHWDGHISETAQCLFSSNKIHLEWLQTVGRLFSIGGNIQKPQISGFGTVMYKLQQNNRKLATIATAKISKTQAKVQVYCPTISTGAFYVRRNGKISITGNSNYYGRPFTMARHAKIPVHLAESFQKGYFTAFPGIPKWHQYVAQQLQTQQKLITPWGRERHFFGRPGDDSTLRESIAFVPQSATGDRTNLALYRLWQHFGSRIRITAQVHDAVYFQYRESDNEEEIVNTALSIIDIRTEHKGHELIVPGDAKVGWNWGEQDSRNPHLNPDGLIKWKGKPDTRSRTPLLSRTL